ncbi:M56 family metallopeptidase [Arthrobacter sp. H14]|uniref:M56 family metallopeptidase n=1 Tax=Arthrobacter sp. H14 TaxID=1312959 RepID=UPI00047A27D6|nr:M56 family metallopeptidase [Arthrobacter sp. H14]
MIWASYALAVLAIILAWPAPIILSKAQWPARSPFTAMILWQAIALAGGLSMIGAMLVWGLDPLGDNLLAGMGVLAGIVFGNRSTEALGFWHVFALSAAFLLGLHLVFTLLLTYIRIHRQRRRHRDLLRILSSPSPESASTVVINHPAPVAYCLPGGARSVTVLSDGLVNLLELDELEAVLIHEQTHLTQRHHLLLWAFAAWRSALPWLPTSQLAQRSVNELIEMLADDEALKSVDKTSLIKAIAIVASGTGPSESTDDDDGALAGSSSALGHYDAGSSPVGTPGGPIESGMDAVTTSHRVSRLITPRPALPQSGQSIIVGMSAALLAAPTVLLIVPGLWAL